MSGPIVRRSVWRRGSTTRTGRACLSWLGAVLAAVLAATEAHGQPVVIPSSGVEFDDADLFEPTTDPSRFLSLYESPTLDAGQFSLGAWMSYAAEPIDGRRIVGGSEENEPVVDNVFDFSLTGAIGLTDRIQLGGALPLYVVDEADVQLGGRVRGGSSFNFGDLLVNGKIDLLPRTGESRFGLSLVPQLVLPTGNRREYAGTGDFSYGALVAADYDAGNWVFSTNAGGLIRDGFGGRDDGDRLEDQLRWGFGAVRHLGERWSLIGEFVGATDLDQEFHSPAEILGGVRWNAGPVDVTLAIGGGINSGKNASLFRFVLGLTAPRDRTFTARMREAPSTSIFGRARPTEGFEGPGGMELSRKTYVVEDHDRNGQVSPGDVIVYTINLLNQSGETAHGITVIDSIPVNTDYVPGTITIDGLPLSDSAAYTAAPPQVVVRIPQLSSESGRNQTSISFKARIRPDLTTAVTIQNVTRVSGDDLLTFSLPPVDTAVFPVYAERENVYQSPGPGGSQRLEVTENIQFEPASATIRPVSYAVLDQVVSILNERPALTIRVVGHTDSLGDDAANLRLSEDRAAEVVDYLVAHGISASRLQAEGRGEYEPIASNDTGSGRAANRRVEFVITGGS